MHSNSHLKVKKVQTWDLLETSNMSPESMLIEWNKQKYNNKYGRKPSFPRTCTRGNNLMKSNQTERTESTFLWNTHVIKVKENSLSTRSRKRYSVSKFIHEVRMANGNNTKQKGEEKKTVGRWKMWNVCTVSMDFYLQTIGFWRYHESLLWFLCRV